MKNKLLAALVSTIAVTSITLPSHAVVRKHDVKKEAYLEQHRPDFLIDMPGEGHGALIAPQYILTVAHLIFADYRGRKIDVAGKPYEIEQVFIREKAKQPDKSWLKGDAERLMRFMKSTHDVALIKLKQPVTDVKPLPLYRWQDEQGLSIRAWGKGSTGDGVNGSVFETKRKKILRKMENVIDKVEGNWVSIQFDKGAEGLPLEGIDGSGDSGGPLITTRNGQDYLVGMFSWDYVEGDLASFKHGLYGGRSYQVRVSSYLDWINQHLTKQ